jgi:hypothetical protein
LLEKPFQVTGLVLCSSIFMLSHLRDIDRLRECLDSDSIEKMGISNCRFATLLAVGHRAAACPSFETIWAVQASTVIMQRANLSVVSGSTIGVLSRVPR